MKGLNKIIFVITIILMFSNVYSLGITVPSQTKFYFEPNMKIEIPYMILSNGASQYISVKIDGDLSQYATTTESQFWLESKGNHHIKLLIKLPNELNPGDHTISIVATENGDGSSHHGVSALTAVRSNIHIYVAYPDDYVRAQIKKLSISKNQDCSFETYVQNLGNKDNNVLFKMKILDENNNTLINSMTNPYEIDTKKEEHKNILLNLDGCSKLKAGIYSVKTTYSFANQNKEISSELRVGKFDIKIENYTTKIKKDSIEKFNVKMKSLWNGPINNIVLRLTIYNNSKELTYSETAPFDIRSWDEINKNLFIDTPKSTGNYSAKIELIYNDENNVKKTVKKEIKINVYKEQKNSFNIMGMAMSKTGSYTIGLILLIIIIIYLSYRMGKSNVKEIKKRKTKKKVNKKK